MMGRKDASDLAARTLAEIAYWENRSDNPDPHIADRERVASDLAGIEDAYRVMRRNVADAWSPEWDALSPAEYLAGARVKECVAGLVRTAALYGVTLDA